MTPQALDKWHAKIEELLDDGQEIEALMVESFGPLAHYAHPDDPYPEAPRWAACGAPILGVPTDGLPCVLCWECVAVMQAKDWMPIPS